jgi:hypothetical protein
MVADHALSQHILTSILLLELVYVSHIHALEFVQLLVEWASVGFDVLVAPFVVEMCVTHTNVSFVRNCDATRHVCLFVGIRMTYQQKIRFWLC